MAIQSDNVPELQTLGIWRGLNQQAQRSSIDDNEEWWNENLFAIGPGNLRSCWGHGPVIYTAPAGTKIVRIFFGFYGNTTPEFQAPPPGQFGWMFLDDGNVDEVDLSTQVVRRVGQIWEPIPPYYWASAKVWRPQFFGSVAGQGGGVLFGSPKGLYAWDGTLYSPGDMAPDWLTNQQETAPGPPIYPMPTGLPGIYTMEVYQQRLFVAGKDVIQFSAPSNGADFSTTDGGGAIGYFGDKLTYTYNDLAASAGYLYVYGDSSTDLISDIQLVGGGVPTSPFTTNFSYMNVDPQVGQRFPRPVGRIGRYMQMWNGAGIFEMRGGEAREIGQKVTNIFNTLVIPQNAADAQVNNLYYPTMAPATMFGFRVLLCNGRFMDPFGVTRNLLLMWHPSPDGQFFWSIASQGLELTNIGYYEQDSVITPYGTDGTYLFQLFAAPDPSLIKRLSTKFLRGTGMQQLTIKNWKRLYMEVYDNFAALPTGPHISGLSFTGTFTTQDGGVPNGVDPVAFDLGPGPFGPLGPHHGMLPQPIYGNGIAGALDLQSVSPDFTIERIHILSEQRTLWGA